MDTDAHTIRIGKFNVNLPMHKAPKLNTRYWCTELGDSGLSLGYIWRGSNDDIERLKSGRCHALQADADLHGKALLSFTVPDDARQKVYTPHYPNAHENAPDA